MQWKRERLKCDKTAPCIETLNLLQVDLAVRDDRSPTGWVFGSFIYDKDAPEIIDYEFPNPADERLKAWLRLIPLGVIFGNKIEHSKVNPHLKVKYGGCPVDGVKRLNGPVDNSNSSCIACHAVGETTEDLSLINSIEWGAMKCDDFWFGRTINPRNQKDKTFTDGWFTLDYSLQLRLGLERCCSAGLPCDCGKKENLRDTGFTVTRSGVRAQ